MDTGENIQWLFILKQDKHLPCVQSECTYKAYLAVISSKASRPCKLIGTLAWTESTGRRAKRKVNIGLVARSTTPKESQCIFVSAGCVKRHLFANMFNIWKSNPTLKVWLCVTHVSLDSCRAKKHTHRCPFSHECVSFPSVVFLPLSCSPPTRLSQVRWYGDSLYALCSRCDRQSICYIQPHRICHNTSQIQVGCALKCWV